MASEDPGKHPGNHPVSVKKRTEEHAEALPVCTLETTEDAVDDVELHEGDVVNFGPGYYEYRCIVERVLRNHGKTNAELTSRERQAIIVEIVREVQFSDPPRLFVQCDDPTICIYRATTAAEFYLLCLLADNSDSDEEVAIPTRVPVDNQTAITATRRYLEYAQFNPNMLPAVQPAAPALQTAGDRFQNRFMRRRATKITNLTDKCINVIVSDTKIRNTNEAELGGGGGCWCVNVVAKLGCRVDMEPPPDQHEPIQSGKVAPFELPRNVFYLTIFTYQKDGSKVYHLANKLVRGYQDWEVYPWEIEGKVDPPGGGENATPVRKRGLCAIS